jgi:hypothetical protein
MGQWLKERVVLGIISALVVAWTVTSPIDLAFGADSCSTDIPSNATTLSSCLGSDFPAGTDVTIGPDGGTKCTRVKVDGSRTGTKALGKITIQQWGSLYFPDQTVELETKGIDVSGLLQVGTATCPIGTTHSTNKVTITFTGARPSSEDHTKGIVVQKAGRLLLYGARGVPGGTPDGISWTHLKEAAGPTDKYGGTVTDNPHNIGRPVPGNGATTLQLAKDVATGAGAWQDGDWIAVATTSYNPFETEFVQINAPVSKGAAGSTVTLKSPQTLQFYHFGGPDPGPPGPDNFIGPKATKNDKDHNWGVDERAEVGLISRNIKLTAKIESGDADKHWGGEIRILNGFKDIDIQGVEIEKFGKDQLGSYPIHLHMAGDLTNTPPLINANSVHHSYNKCVTIHSTQKVTIQNMVCARIVGHIFYQEVGDEAGVKFQNNLGLGAMSNYFDINAPTDAIRTTLIKNFWWAGDNLTNDSCSPNCNGYDGFRVFNTDAQDNPVHGACTKVNNLGEAFLTQGIPPCDSMTEFYNEPASGFWVIHPGTELTGNSIGGCQGAGRAYWYVAPTCALKRPPPDPPPSFCDGQYAGIKTLLQNLKFEKIGKFENNRAHSCFAAIYNETDGKIVNSEQLFPHSAPNVDSPPLVATFDKFTATRNRARALWMRPTWIAFTNARVASNRINITIVTSGGLDGNAPGVWGLLKDSVIVGLSTNNVDRFGPCPTETTPSGDLSNGVGGKFGCIDQTPGPQFAGETSKITGGENIGDNSGGGYPVPEWNFFGYMIYDGPIRIFDNHFVNFKKDPTSLWTKADQEFFTKYAAAHKIPDTDPAHDFIYEGDAVLGWFDSNQSAYPTSTVVKGLTFTNVDLRHQVFTESVSRGGTGKAAALQFNDGDKNTAVIDLDGSLTGFRTVTSKKEQVEGLEPISLNNLPFNASSNSVDECLAEGAQDTFFEGRPTSLISPGSMATLEFGALHPSVTNPKVPDEPKELKNHTQILTFSKDSKDFGEHQSMALHSRNAQGLWEPKVTSGYGYTVKACPSKKLKAPPDQTWQPDPTDTTCDPDTNNLDTGIPSYVSVGLTDAVKPGIDPQKPETWFFTRLGVCYTDKDGKHPSDASKFSITRGFKSYAGGNVQFGDPQLQLFFNNLENRYNGEVCRQLDRQDLKDLCPDDTPGCADGPFKGVKGCPAHGVTAFPPGGCPFPSTCDAPADNCKNSTACIYPKNKLTSAGSIGELTKDGDLTKDGEPVLDKYFYDPSTGMLFFNIVQDLPNPIGPSPLGSCSDPKKTTDDPNCPDLAKKESYYACPAAGCPHYVVLLNDPSYQPGRSTCTPYPTYEQNPPLNENVLVLKEDATNRAIETKVDTTKPLFPHHVSKASQDTPICLTTTP